MWEPYRPGLGENDEPQEPLDPTPPVPPPPPPSGGGGGVVAGIIGAVGIGIMAIVGANAGDDTEERRQAYYDCVAEHRGEESLLTPAEWCDSLDPDDEWDAPGEDEGWDVFEDSGYYDEDYFDY